MDGLSLQMPVTLVVKAPNQKIQDLTVECGLEWTIRKLKEHLSTVYPNKPTRNEQKLIYSGKLLQDHQMLKDVLRQYEQNQTTHTVHLVCSHMAAEAYNEMKQSTPVPSNSTAQDNGEGLRHRHPPQMHATHAEAMPQPSVPQSIPAPQQPPVAPMDFNAMQQMFGANPMMYGGFLPGMMAMTPEQMAWMQQLYTQQMNYYLQMYQTPMPTPPATPNSMSQLQPAVPPQPEAAQPDMARQADQPIRMNAQGGGMVLDDEDGEEGRRRDWLDWLYTFSRFSVLLSIVYFYSTPSRFILVVTFFLFFYLFQGGWFNLNRNAVDRRQQQPAQQQPQEAPQPQQPEATTGDQSAEEGSGEDGESSEDEAPQGDSTEPVVPPSPPPLGGLEVAWNFFSSFFSSLVPQQPPAVNAN